jgi:molybdopterin-guanine dinucleotide biosynthesis protein A
LDTLMPSSSERFLRRLVPPSPADVDAMMPRTHDRSQPLCAVYAAPCARTIRLRIQAGLLAATALAECLAIEEIGPEELATYDPDGLMFVNVNTPHDYERAKDLMDRMRGNRAAMGDRITDATS